MFVRVLLVIHVMSVRSFLFMCRVFPDTIDLVSSGAPQGSVLDPLIITYFGFLKPLTP